VLSVCAYLNLKDPPSEQQRNALADFISSQFGDLTTEDVLLAFKRAASGELKVDANLSQLSIFFWGRVLSAHNESLKAIPNPAQSDDYGMTAKEFVESGTKAKVDKALDELAAKTTAWRNDGPTGNKLTHGDMYAMRRDEFALLYADKFGSRWNAREVWNKAVPLKRWMASLDTEWVDVELGKALLP
jgi:hypothetical protein